jgi:transglutaminase/protease-like cytokinesis protein 3
MKKFTSFALEKKTIIEKPSTQTDIVQNEKQELNISEKQQTNVNLQNTWPFPKTLHPSVINIPDGIEGDITSVANFLASEASHPFLLVKALHDYVADRISYDFSALQAGQIPPQDAETVFRTRKAVCAGYANLLKALGSAIGFDVIYITGNSRDLDGNISGRRHAWNAVNIEGDWYLVDVTWDAGSVIDGVWKKRYSWNLIAVKTV